MSDEEDEGYKGPLHPRLTMDDITEVSGPEEIERKNTFQITKNTEARSKTVFSVIVGALVGLALCLMFAPLLGYMFSSFFVLLGGILAPFFAVGTIRDIPPLVLLRIAEQNGTKSACSRSMGIPYNANTVR